VFQLSDMSTCGQFSVNYQNSTKHIGHVQWRHPLRIWTVLAMISCKITYMVLNNYYARRTSWSPPVLLKCMYQTMKVCVLRIYNLPLFLRFSIRGRHC
jgi:hypothetical protein